MQENSKKSKEGSMDVVESARDEERNGDEGPIRRTF